jgi:hypothetical protein
MSASITGEQAVRPISCEAQADRDGITSRLRPHGRRLASRIGSGRRSAIQTRSYCLGTGIYRRAHRDGHRSGRMSTIMMLVQLRILAVPEVAVTFLQIVRSGLYPCPEAVATKRCHRPDVVMNEIAPGGDRFARKDIELQFYFHGLLP